MYEIRDGGRDEIDSLCKKCTEARAKELMATVDLKKTKNECVKQYFFTETPYVESALLSRAHILSKSLHILTSSTDKKEIKKLCRRVALNESGYKYKSSEVDFIADECSKEYFSNLSSVSLSSKFINR